MFSLLCTQLPILLSWVVSSSLSEYLVLLLMYENWILDKWLTSKCSRYHFVGSGGIEDIEVMEDNTSTYSLYMVVIFSRNYSSIKYWIRNANEILLNGRIIDGVMISRKSKKLSITCAFLVGQELWMIE